MIENAKPTFKRQTGRPSTESTLDECFSPKKTRKARDLFEVSDDIEFDDFEHWPTHWTERPRYFLCKEKTRWDCNKRIMLEKGKELFQ